MKSLLRLSRYRPLLKKSEVEVAIHAKRWFCTGEDVLWKAAWKVMRSEGHWSKMSHRAPIAPERGWMCVQVGCIYMAFVSKLPLVPVTRKKKIIKPLYSASANVTVKEVACFCLSVEFRAVMTLGVFNFSHQRTKYSLSFGRGRKDSAGFVQSNFVNVHLT